MRFRPKSPEQIEEEYRFVAAQKTVGFEEKMPEIDSKTFSLSKEEFQKRIEEKPELKKYLNSYVEGLRKMKKETYEYYKNEGLNNPEESGPVPLRKKILKRVQEGNIGDKFFSDEELENAKNNTDSFYKLFKTLKEERPSAILHSIEYLRPLFKPEEIKEIINKASEKSPRDVAFHLKNVADLYSREELSSLVKNISRQDSYYLCHTILNQDEVREKLDPDLKKVLAIKTVEKYVTPDIDKYLAEGLVTPEEAKSSFLKYLSGDVTYTNEPGEEKYLKLFSSDEDKKLLIKLIGRRIESGDTNGVFPSYAFKESLEKYEQFLGSQWKENIIKKIIEEEPYTIIINPKEAHAIIGQEEYLRLFEQWVKTNTRSINEFDYRHIKKEAGLNPEHLKMLSEMIIERDPELALSDYKNILKNIPENEKPGFIRNLIERTPDIVSRSPEIIDELTDISEEERRKFAREMIMDSRSFSYFLQSYLEKDSCGDLLREIIPPEEIEEFIFKKSDLEPSRAFWALDKLRDVLGGDKGLEKFIRRFVERAPDEAIYNFYQYSYLIPAQEREPFIRNLISLNEIAGLEAVNNWSEIISKESTQKIIKEIAKNQPMFTLDRIDTIAYHIEESERVEFIKSLIQSNPALATGKEEQIKKFLPEISKEEIIDRALEDEQKIAFAPNLIKEAFKKIKSSKTEDQLANSAREGALIYGHIENILQEGYGEDYLKIIKSENPKLKEQKKLLESGHGFVLVKRFGKKNEVEPFPQSSSELKERLNRLTSDFIEAEGLTPEEEEKAVESFGGAAPLLTYAHKHKNNPEISSLLKEIFKEAGKGTYRKWRFGLDRPLEETIAEGKLPKKLNKEQLIEWSGDEKTDINTTLKTSSKDISTTIKTVLKSSAPDLGSETLQEEDVRKVMEEVKKEIRETGQKLSELGEGITHLDKDKKEKTLIEISELKKLRDRLIDEKDLLRLTMLTTEEISQGYLLEGVKKQRSQKLAKFIRRLKGNFPQAENVFTQIEGALSELKAGDQSAQNLMAEDTSDLKTSFHIGADPVASCQHYETGGINQALLGYCAEANTKAIITKNEKGNIIGRRITRLLETNDGSPAMFLETKYASTASGIVDQIMLTHAIAKAEKNGFRLFIKDDCILPEGYEAIPDKETLTAKGARAPQIYVDAEGGTRSHGRIRISGAKEIVKSKEKNK